MIVFWIVAALLVTFALVSLTAPLVRKRRVAQRARTDYDVAVFADQLKEVDRDIERGLLNDTQAEAARTEIKRRLLVAAGEDTEEVAHKPGGAVASNLGLVLILALLVPAGALGLYRYLGSPQMPDLPLAGRDDPAMREAKQSAEMKRLIGQLEQKMAQNPNDQRGWELLASSYMSQERYADAAQALARVVTLSNRAADALSSYGEALTMANKFSVTPVAKAVFEEALQKDPADPRGAYYLGVHAAQNGDVRKAYDLWTALAARSAPDAPWMAALNEQIARAAGQLGIAPPKMAAPAVGPGPSEADRAAAAQMTDTERDAMIRSMVQRLADRLAEHPDDREGWLKLARAYQVLGETAKAADAQAKAAALAK